MCNPTLLSTAEAAESPFLGPSLARHTALALLPSGLLGGEIRVLGGDEKRHGIYLEKAIKKPSLEGHPTFWGLVAPHPESSG